LCFDIFVNPFMSWNRKLTRTLAKLFELDRHEKVPEKEIIHNAQELDDYMLE